MIAVAVFSMLIIMFATAVPLADKSSNMNGQYAQAISLCQHKIDQLRAVGFGRLNYTELSDAEIVDLNPTSSPYTFSTVDSVPEYLQNATTSLHVDTVAWSTRVLKVTATITWKTTGYESKTSSMSLSAYISNAD